MPSMRNDCEPYGAPVPPRGARTWRLVTDEFGYQEWRHRCAVCKGWKTVDAFYLKKTPTGGKWESYCKCCKISYNRKLITRDEENHRSYLEERRIKYRDARERRGLRCYPQKGTASLAFPIIEKSSTETERLPVGPIIEWLEKKIEEGWTYVQLAAHAGIDARAFNRIKDPRTTWVHFSTVDAILTGEGSTFIWELYPNEYEELLAA